MSPNKRASNTIVNIAYNITNLILTRIYMKGRLDEQILPGNRRESRSKTNITPRERLFDGEDKAI